jgi:polar amino acid transport system substrate-binding protein
MIGAGNFAQGTLLPKMKNHCNFVGVATARGNIAKYVANKYGFSYCAQSANDLIEDPNINTVFITTRHNTHAEFAIKAIEKGKNVFVEKPLAINEEELEQIKEVYSKGSRNRVMVGFNRRFAPASIEMKKLFAETHPKTINMRINAGVMPMEHWVNDPEIGGGRIIGEGCHFIDLAMFFAASPITHVSAFAMEDAGKLDNSVVINLAFKNGSVASINYLSNGNKNVNKEYIEVFCGGVIAVIDDFKTLTVHNRSVKKTTYGSQDKGHEKEIELFLKSIAEGTKAPISFEECYLSSLATLKANQSIREKRVIVIND